MRRFIVLTGLGWALPLAAHAQAFDWRPVNHETAVMIYAGAFDAALPVIQDALGKCPDAATPTEAGLCTAIFSENLGNVREHQGDLAGAEAALRQTLASRAAVLPPTDPLIGQANFFLALFFHRQNRQADEVAALQAAETIAQANGPSHRTELAGLLTRHAIALDALGRPAEALTRYQQAYDLVSGASGPTSIDALSALGNLFTSHVNTGTAEAGFAAITELLASPDALAIDPTQRAMLTGKLALAITGAARAKTVLAFAAAALPDIDLGFVTDPDASFTLLNGAAHLNASVGDPARAVELARRARAVASGKWGPASYPVSTALRTEAEAETARHDPQAAIVRLTEAASILDAPSFALNRVQVEIELGKLRTKKIGHRDEAVAGERALVDSNVVTRAEQSTKAAALTLLGEDLVRLEAYDQGAAICAQAADLAAGQTRLARDYPVKAQLCLASAALGQGHPDAALDAAQLAFASLWAGVTPPAEPNRAFQLQVADLKARVLRDSGRNAEALAAYKDELALAEKAGDTAARGAVLSQIAFIQRQLGLLKESEESSVAGLALLGSDGPLRPRANLLNNRAVVAVTQGRSAEAVALFEASLALRRAEDVTEPLAIASGERDMAAALSNIGRNTEAGRHMDIAIDGFRGLGPARQAYLVVALDRRVSIATAAGDLARAESALRELLALRDPTSDEAAVGRITLAGLLDNQGRRREAASLRAEARAIVVAKHGADSKEALQVLLSEEPSLRSSGRLREADAVARNCTERASSMHDVLGSCLTAQAETALDAGAVRDASGAAAKAVIEAETHWTQNNSLLLQALMLRVRAAAAAGDTEGVLRLYDRVHGLSPDRGVQRGWTDVGEGRMLIQSGETEIGLAMIRLALRQANVLHDTGLAVAATGALAEHALNLGEGREAIALWEAILPLVSEDTPAHRVTVLEGMGNAANGMARYRDAAHLFAEAVSLGHAAMGAGSPVYQRLVVAWAEALGRSGEPAQAEDALRMLDADSSPSAQRQHTIGLIHLAQEAHDPVATVLLGHQLVAQAEVAFGPASVAAAYARLDLLEVMLGAGKHVDQADLDATLRAIVAQDSSWHVALRAERIQGLLAASRGQLDQAQAAFRQAETIAVQNEGAGSLSAADAVSNQASVRLRANDVAGADTLYRRALGMASPGGDWHNPVWARIANEDAVAAERSGDVARAVKLRHDADELIPSVTERVMIRWI